MANGWLEHLEAGDEVIVRGGWDRAGEVRRVDRLTATQIVVGKSRYRRTDGYQVGSSGYRTARIEEATPERRELAEQSRRCAEVRYRLAQAVPAALSSEKWAAILAILDTATTGE